MKLATPIFGSYIVVSLDKPGLAKGIKENVQSKGGAHFNPLGNPGTPPPKFNVSLEKNIDDNKAKELVKTNPEVLDVLPSIPIQLIKPAQTAAVPAAATSAWGLDAVGAHTSPFTGKGIKVAVLDTGIDRSHAAFSDSELQIDEEDFTGEGNGDKHAHGTHCAGTIFGRDVNGTRIGIARGVTDVLIGKVLGSQGGESGAIVQAINWAVKEGAHVISMSLGIDFPGLVDQLVARGINVQAATSIALEAYRKNVMLFERTMSLVRSLSLGNFTQPVLIVAAAGNESNRPNYEIAVSPPAVSDGIMSVGALGKNEHGFFIGNFSNTGPVISGPGVDILSAQLGGGVTTMSGTSMATPHVAGVAALWAEKLQSVNNFKLDMLTAQLNATASRNNLPAIDPVAFGAGLVQAPQN